MNHDTLLSVRIGDTGRVRSLSVPEAIKKRFLDLGLTPGTPVTCLYEAPSGNPKAYLIRGTVIAIRNQDAALIRLR